MHALILIDLQNDFVPTGALAVPDGERVIPVVNRLQARFPLIVATKDWHPADHGSFASQHPGRKPGEVVDLNGWPQVLWPDHCVQHTPGAEFVPTLQTQRLAGVFFKGTDPRIDSYSTFFDNGHRQATGLDVFLRNRQVDQVYLAGLATDYCVKFSALDAVGLGFRVALIADACRAVNLQSGDDDRALDELRRAGVAIVTSEAAGLE